MRNTNRVNLVRRVAILDDVLVPHGFRFHFRDEGTGSGGPFAWGEYVRGERRLEIHFRYSLGLVTYQLGARSLAHAAYITALGAAERARYPAASEDPLDAFRDLAHDLSDVIAPDFLEGSGDILRREAARLAADAPGRQREHLARAVGDVEKRERARERFHAGDYAAARALLEDLRYPDLATIAERRMLEVARSRTM